MLDEQPRKPGARTGNEKPGCVAIASGITWALSAAFVLLQLRAVHDMAFDEGAASNEWSVVALALQVLVGVPLALMCAYGATVRGEVRRPSRWTFAAFGVAIVLSGVAVHVAAHL